VAPPSTIKAHRYVYEIPLSEMLPVPKLLIKKEREPVHLFPFQKCFDPDPNLRCRNLFS